MAKMLEGMMQHLGKENRNYKTKINAKEEETERVNEIENQLRKLEVSENQERETKEELISKLEKEGKIFKMPRTTLEAKNRENKSLEKTMEGKEEILETSKMRNEALEKQLKGLRKSPQKADRKIKD